MAIAVCQTVLYAQINIHSNGNISVNSTETPVSPISINSGGRVLNYMAYYGNMNAYFARTYGGCDSWNWGVTGSFDNLPTYNTANFYIGVRGSAYPSDGTPKSYGSSYGLMGIAGNMTPGHNYGVFGQLRGDNNGAAVYGGIGYTDNGILLNDKYAGYFNGKVHVNGALTTASGINGTLLQRAFNQEEVTGDLMDEYEQLPLTDYFAKLNPVVYRVAEKNIHHDVALNSDTIAYTSPVSLIEKQIAENQHFGLLAEQLEATFPSLVYTQEDGTKSINYVEMIPLLVQTINELSTRLALLEKTGKSTLLSERNASFSVESGNVYFSLPENVKSAYVMIYDLYGNKKDQIQVTPPMRSVDLGSTALGNGIYICSLVVNGTEVCKKQVSL